MMRNTDTLLLMLLRLRWMEVVLVTDNSNVAHNENLESWLNDHGVQHVLVRGSEAVSGQWVNRVVKTGEDSWRPLNILLNCSHTCIISALTQASRLEYNLRTQSAFGMTSRWLLVTTESDAFYDQFKVTNFTIDNVVVADISKAPRFCSHGNRPESTCSCSSVCTLTWSATGHRQWSHVLTTDPALPVIAIADSHTDRSSGVNYDTVLFPNVRYGYNRRLLTIIVKEWSQYVVAHRFNNTRMWSGLLLDLLDAASETLNFTYHLIDATDMKWGSGTVLDSQSGLYGYVNRKEVDLALAATEMTSSRQEAMDFAAPVTFWNVVMVYRIPALTLQTRMPLGPLGKNVALAVCVALIVVTVFVTLLEIVFLHRLGQLNGTPANIYVMCWKVLKVLDRGLEVVGGAVLLKPTQKPLKSRSARTLLWSWWMLSVVMAAVYCGTLTAFLSVSKQPELFSKPQDLLTKDHAYTWGTIGDSSFDFMFQHSNDSLYRQLWAGMKRFAAHDPIILSQNITRLIEKVKTDDFVLFFPGLTAAAVLDGDCNVTVIDAGMKQAVTSVVLSKGSSLTKPLSDLILHLHSSGVLSQWTDKWFPRVTCPSPPSGPVVISLSHVQSVLLMLPVGMGLAILVMAAEMAYNKAHQQPFF